MTDDTIRAVLDRYETELKSLLPSAARATFPSVQADVLHYQHLLTMLPKMREMQATAADADSADEYIAAREKLMRWLGFVQGALWVKGIYGIDEMREHNKPPDEPFRERE